MEPLRWSTGESDGLATRLHEEIRRFNEDATELRDGRTLEIAVHTPAGELVAGLTGWTWGGCGYVDVLWVRSDARGRGIGSRLLDTAEREAVERGCSRMALSTHSFQAPEFYRARHYTVCGETPDYPRGYTHLYLVKSLVPPPAPQP